MSPEEAVEEAEQRVQSSDITHKQAANQIGISARTWRKWRNGSPPSGEHLALLKEWLESNKPYDGPDALSEHGVGGYGRPRPPEDDAPDPNISGSKAGTEHLSHEEVVERQRKIYARKREKNQAKKSQTVRFDYGPICLAFQGDEHYGNSGCDIDHALEDAHLIADTPGMFAIKMGDIVDNFIVGYLLGENAKQSLAIESQWECAKRHLDILSNNVIAVVGGNHGGWTHALSYIDPVRQITPDDVLYDPDEITFRLKVGTSSKKVFLRHKFSKGHSQWNETHALEKAAKFTHPGYDIYAAAHTHSGLHLKQFAKRGTDDYAVAIQTDTYKKYDDYGDEQGYSAYPKEDVAGALIVHEDGETIPMKSLETASRYMQKFYD
jgi:hypothetical protein